MARRAVVAAAANGGILQLREKEIFWDLQLLGS
jgi:hypothetical protein